MPSAQEPTRTILRAALARDVEAVARVRRAVRDPQLIALADAELVALLAEEGDDLGPAVRALDEDERTMGGDGRSAAVQRLRLPVLDVDLDDGGSEREIVETRDLDLDL